MFDTLNDECQLAIIKYLNLNDQLALYKATKEDSNRLNTILVNNWKLQRCFKLNSKNYKQFKDMPKMFDIFLFNICRTMQELELEWVTVEFLKHWKNYKFPSLQKLEYTLDRCDWNNHSADEAIQIMAKLFPELRNVKTHNGFYYGLLEKWTQLRKLELSEWCVNDNSHECPEMIIKCQQLEQLTLSCDFHNPKVYDAILTLPKLHTLAYCLGFMGDDILAELEKRGRKIRRLIFNDCIWLYSMSTLHKLSNLRHLTLLRENNFSSEKLHELIACIKHLEQLNLVDFEIWSGEPELWQIVASCPSLKILYISGMKLGKDFFQYDRRIMEETLNNRSQPLTLHCHNTGENEELIHQNFEHSKLKLSFEPLKLDLVGWNMAQMHFKPLLPA